jgi:hypothetical protein
MHAYSIPPATTQCIYKPAAATTGRAAAPAACRSHLLLSLLPCCLRLLQACVDLHQLISKCVQRRIPVGCALLRSLQRGLDLLHSHSTAHTMRSMLSSASAKIVSHRGQQWVASS